MKRPRRPRRRLAALWYHRRPQLRWWGHFLLGLGTLRRWRQMVAWGGSVEGPASQAPDPPAATAVPGAIHVHTTYSDGLGSVPQVVAAAVAAGLRFVLLTDHDTLKPLSEGWDGYHDGCLVLVGAEVRVYEGHVMALNLPAGYGFERMHAQAQLERLRNAGGLAFFLPDEDDHFSWEKLRQLPFTGMEVINLHNLALQVASIPAILAFAVRYFTRGPMAAFGILAARPDGDLALWDRLGRERPVAGIASVDAHSGIAIGRNITLRIPTYEQSFRLVQTHLLVPGGFTGDAERDREATYAALVAGRTHLVLGDDPRAQQVRFWAEAGTSRATVGEQVEEGQGLSFHALSPSAKTLFRIYRDGRLMAQAEGRRARFESRGAGRYRLEVYRRRGRIGRLRLGVTPWLFTNCITVRPVPAQARRGPVRLRPSRVTHA